MEASDPDEGKNGRVFYYIINGNDGKWFSIDRTYGHIYTKKKLDREERDNYVIQVHTTNNANHVCEGTICDIEPVVDPSTDNSVILVHIFVEDKNDNLPQFETNEFNIGNNHFFFREINFIEFSLLKSISRFFFKYFFFI